MLNSEAATRKRWMRVLSFLLFLVFMLAGALGAIIPEIFGQLFGNIGIGFPQIVKEVTSRPAISFFIDFPVWAWLVAAVVGLIVSWVLIRLRMATTGGAVPVKTTMLLSLVPVGVLAVEVFCFIAPTQEIIASTQTHRSPDGDGHDHSGHDHGDGAEVETAPPSGDAPQPVSPALPE